MTCLELYSFALVELNKLKAPSLLLEDYNYFINKAIQQYINIIYNRYDINQQTTDDLRVLKATAILTPKPIETTTVPTNGILRATHYVVLPEDYVHLLNCIVEYEVNSPYKCHNKGDVIAFAAKRLTSDMFGSIINNAYLKPDYKRPYYFINNINTSNTVVTNPSTDEQILSYNKDGIKWEKQNSSLIDSITPTGDRVANSSEVRLELRLGNNIRTFKPIHVYVDYIKAPMFINLTLDDINNVADRTAILEWPDYVCYEIINIFTRLVMENASDPRIQTNVPINETINNPLSGQSKK